MFLIESSGVSWGYHGCARQTAKTEMEKLKKKDMTMQDVVKEVASRIIYVVHDEVKDTSFELELSWVGEATGGK
ncbi:Proteasome subunit alpha type-3 [Nucella lapillus]